MNKDFKNNYIGDWELGIGPNPQSPIPNPQSPILKIKLKLLFYFIYYFIYYFNNH